MVTGRRYYEPSRHGAEARYADHSEKIRAILDGGPDAAGRAPAGGGQDSSTSTPGCPPVPGGPHVRRLRSGRRAVPADQAARTRGRIGGQPQPHMVHAAIPQAVGSAGNRPGELAEEQPDVNTGQLAELIAAGFFALGMCAVVYVMIRLGRLISAATSMVSDYRDRADLLLLGAQEAVDRASEQLDRTDAIAASMDDVTANMAELSGHVSGMAAGQEYLGRLRRPAAPDLRARLRPAPRHRAPAGHPGSRQAGDRPGPAAPPGPGARAARVL